MRKGSQSSVPISDFPNISENVAILRGSFDQPNVKFDEFSRGKQCTGIAAIACVAFFVSDPVAWCGVISIIYLL